eukprot:764376-Hanusia_phi.AAC.7
MLPLASERSGVEGLRAVPELKRRRWKTRSQPAGKSLGAVKLRISIDCCHLHSEEAAEEKKIEGAVSSLATRILPVCSSSSRVSLTILQGAEAGDVMAPKPERVKTVSPPTSAKFAERVTVRTSGALKAKEDWCTRKEETRGMPPIPSSCPSTRRELSTTLTWSMVSLQLSLP